LKFFFFVINKIKLSYGRFKKKDKKRSAASSLLDDINDTQSASSSSKNDMIQSSILDPMDDPDINQNFGNNNNADLNEQQQQQQQQTNNIKKRRIIENEDENNNNIHSFEKQNDTVEIKNFTFNDFIFNLISEKDFNSAKMILKKLSEDELKKYSPTGLNVGLAICTLLQDNPKPMINLLSILLENEYYDINLPGKGMNKNINGITILQYLCRFGLKETFDVLIYHPNLDINKCGNKGAPPLFILCETLNFDMIKALLENCENVDIEVQSGVQYPTNPSIDSIELLNKFKNRNDLN